MIIYFSATGNSRIVASLLSNKLSDSAVIDIRGNMLTLPVSTSLDARGSQNIVWVFPVHAWAIPDMLADFMSQVDIAGAEQSTHHMVCTCGDDIGMTDRQWRRLMSARGWETGVCASVQMPNTYVTFPGFDVDSKTVESAKLAAATTRVNEIAAMIKGQGSQQAQLVVRGSFPRFKSGTLKRFFKRFLMNPSEFGSNDACISCGRCASVCPTGNIVLDSDRRPQWGKECMICLACYHVCPRHAVRYGRQTRNKGQYQTGLKRQNKTL